MSPRPAPPDPEQNKKIRAEHRKARKAAPPPDPVPVAEDQPEQTAQVYKITSKHSVFGVDPGGTVELTPDQAEFLLEVGHIALPEPEAAAPDVEVPPEPGQSPKESGE
jgi:hypothetical protein